MEDRLITLKELYENADEMKLNSKVKTNDFAEAYRLFRGALKEKIEPLFKSETNIEIQSRVIEILELKVSELDSITAYFIMVRPFANKWKSRGRYLFYFDTVKLKLGGLIYLLGNGQQ